MISSAILILYVCGFTICNKAHEPQKYNKKSVHEALNPYFLFFIEKSNF